MFESDDFDQVLSQFDLPEIPTKERKTHNTDINFVKNDCNTLLESKPQESQGLSSDEQKFEIQSPKSNLATASETQAQTLSVVVGNSLNPISDNGKKEEMFASPKHTKRKIINSHFDKKIKRKFPGPAGLLTGTLEESKDDTICHMELLSQDIEFSQNSLWGDIFESSLWLGLQNDVKKWNLHNIDGIKTIKQQALAGNLRRRKAQTVTAFIETVDRSAIDPLIILRDATGHIKCTLHRDAWSTFSMYIVSEHCALVLWKPTVLTTGGAFKKHYLNITLSNIYAIYSSTVVKEEDRQLPEGYVIVYEDDYTVIKTESTPQDLGPNLNGSITMNGATEEILLDDLDSIFSDELF